MAEIVLEKLGQSEFDRMASPLASDLAVVYRDIIDQALEIVDESESQELTPEETLKKILDFIDGK